MGRNTSGVPGDKVKYYRALHGFSQEHLARLAQTQASSISRVERNRHNYTKQLLEKLAAAFGVTVEDLFRPVGEHPQPLHLSPTQEELLRLSAHLPTPVLAQLLRLLQACLQTAPLSSARHGPNWTAWQSLAYHELMDPVEE